MQAFDFVTDKIKNILSKHKVLSNKDLVEVSLNFSDIDKRQGQLNTTVLSKISPNTQDTKNKLAKLIIQDLELDEKIEKIEFSKNTFLNITFTKKFWQIQLKKVLLKDKTYLEPNIGNNKKVNIEFVSANPTGPMHIGHVRSAVLGMVLVNVLKKCQYKVTKEFYVNNFGDQIDTLAQSTLIRYKNLISNTKQEIPKGLYPGTYLKKVAKKLFSIHQDKLLQYPTKKQVKLIKSFCVDEMLNLIKNDLKSLGVYHDVFFFESDLHETHQIQKTLELLKKEGLVYEGTMPDAKTEKAKTKNKNVKHLILKTTQFKDNQDRAITKEDGSYSYFGAEIAYLKNKIDRNFDIYLTILGADHIGYVRRYCAAFEAIYKAKNDTNNIQGNKISKEAKNIVLVTQLVHYMKNNTAVRMSKRSGDLETLQDVLKKIPKDAIKYFMVSKKNDTSINFDIEKALEQSKDNPIFYIQYAHTRCYSLISKAKNMNEKIIKTNKKTIDSVLNQTLQNKEEINLVICLSQWCFCLEEVAKKYEVHKLTIYLSKLASAFHKLWESKTKDLESYRFLVEKDLKLTKARILLAQATMLILKEGLKLLQIPAKKFM